MSDKSCRGALSSEVTKSTDVRILNSPIVPQTRCDGSLVSRGQQPRRVLVLTGPFPSTVLPDYGLPVKERVRAVAHLRDFELRVVSPVPYFPGASVSRKWSVWTQFPREETVERISVVRPRYFLPPKLGGYVHSRLMFPAVRRAVERLRIDFKFDLIDAHRVYPTGLVAAWLGRLYDRPVVITGRGEDMCRFPGRPVIGGQIRSALRAATECVGISREIAEAMKANGAAPDRVSVIPNGVDLEKFRPLPKTEARQRLSLPADAKIVVSVGDQFENKGFHILIDALPEILKAHPDVVVVIVGGPPRHGSDHGPQIKKRVRKNGLGSRVHFPGRRPHDELAWWYSAADVFALMSGREGSPNVLLESLACGTPAVATAVGGIVDLLSDPRLGILLQSRSAPAAAEGISRALQHPWDHRKIRTVMESHAWSTTAAKVAGVFQRAIASYCAVRAEIVGSGWRPA